MKLSLLDEKITRAIVREVLDELGSASQTERARSVFVRQTLL